MCLLLGCFASFESDKFIKFSGEINKSTKEGIPTNQQALRHLNQLLMMVVAAVKEVEEVKRRLVGGRQ